MGSPVFVAAFCAAIVCTAVVAFLIGRSGREVRYETSDFATANYIEATEELLGRWTYNHRGDVREHYVAYQEGRYEVRFRRLGLLNDTFNFDPMLQFAMQAAKVRANTPKNLRETNSNYLAPIHDENVIPDLMRGLRAVLASSKRNDEGQLCVAQGNERIAREIYDRVSREASERVWKRRQEWEAEQDARFEKLGEASK